MILLPEELALANLRGEIPSDERGFMTKKEAYKWLVELSGEDFGMDEKKWAKWVKQAVGHPN